LANRPKTLANESLAKQQQFKVNIGEYLSKSKLSYCWFCTDLFSDRNYGQL